ncbi:MAG: hypothetical protein ACLQIB_38095 [Isosphaeraceae bacterium]
MTESAEYHELASEAQDREERRRGFLLGDLAASRQRLREVAERLRLRRAVNLGGCLLT